MRILHPRTVFSLVLNWGFFLIYKTTKCNRSSNVYSYLGKAVFASEDKLFKKNLPFPTPNLTCSFITGCMKSSIKSSTCRTDQHKNAFPKEGLYPEFAPNLSLLLPLWAVKLPKEKAAELFPRLWSSCDSFEVKQNNTAQCSCELFCRRQSPNFLRFIFSN